MAFSNAVSLSDVVGGTEFPEINRAEREGLYTKNGLASQIIAFDKDSGDTSGTIQTGLAVVHTGRVIKRDGTLVPSATVRKSGNGSIASLASLDNSTTLYLQVFGWKARD